MTAKNVPAGHVELFHDDVKRSIVVFKDHADAYLSQGWHEKGEEPTPPTPGVGVA